MQLSYECGCYAVCGSYDPCPMQTYTTCPIILTYLVGNITANRALIGHPVTISIKGTVNCPFNNSSSCSSFNRRSSNSSCKLQLCLFVLERFDYFLILVQDINNFFTQFILSTFKLGTCMESHMRHPQNIAFKIRRKAT